MICLCSEGLQGIEGDDGISCVEGVGDGGKVARESQVN